MTQRKCRVCKINIKGVVSNFCSLECSIISIMAQSDSKLFDIVIQMLNTKFRDELE